jgi:signal peptidase II
VEIVIILLGIAVDRFTKLWVVESLLENSNIDILGNFLSFLYIKNRGAAFGILQNKLYFLAAITIVVVIGIIYYIFKFKPQWGMVRISLSLIISGALGNLVDRIVYGYVVDFIALHLGDIYYFPIFNIADILVVTGTMLLTFYLLKEGKNES